MTNWMESLAKKKDLYSLRTLIFLKPVTSDEIAFKKAKMFPFSPD